MSIDIKSQVYIPDTTNVPQNCGYIINGKKIKGTDEKTTSSQEEVYIDPETREIHTFNRHNYHCWMLADGESIASAFHSHNAVQNGRRYCMSIQKISCPEEKKNNGVCTLRYDDDHCKYHYHFTRIINGKLLYSKGKPVCRYSLTNPGNLCWERNNPEHHKVFCH